MIFLELLETVYFLNGYIEEDDLNLSIQPVFDLHNKPNLNWNQWSMIKFKKA